MSSAPVVRLLLASLVICAAFGQSDLRLDQEQPDRKYLVPLLWHGPNNQVNSIKETMALALLLNRSVVLPDLREHGFTDKGNDPMAFQVLFDVERIQAGGLHAVLLADLAKEYPSWDGKLDAAVTLLDEQQTHIRRLTRALGLEPPRDKLWFTSPLRASTGCSKELLQQLHDMLLPYDVVGVQTFHGLFSTSQVLAGPLECDAHSGGGDAGDQQKPEGQRGGDSGGGGSSASSSSEKARAPSLCCDAFQRASDLLRKSERVLDTAQEFVEARIGKGVRFVAAHVRPYPDPCVRTWALGTEELRREHMPYCCATDYLYDRFAPNVLGLMQRYNASRLLLMTHPLVRGVVGQRLRALGVQPVVMELGDVAALAAGTGAHRQGGEGHGATTGQDPAGHGQHLGVRQGDVRQGGMSLSYSLLAMVEEAVCTHAVAFVGTKESSMTGTIVQERLATGHSADDTYTFMWTEGHERVPMSISQFYSAKVPRHKRNHDKECGLEELGASGGNGGTVPNRSRWR